MKNKQGITTGLSLFDRTLEISAVSALVVLWAIVLWSLATLPDFVPTHFDLSGKPDKYGDKTTLLILPALGTVIYAVLGFLGKKSFIVKNQDTMTPAEIARQLTIAARMLRVLKFVILVLFMTILLFTFLTARGKANGLGIWFLPFVILCTLAPQGWYLTRLASRRTDKNKTIS